jgi:hypothetical protein
MLFFVRRSDGKSIVRPASQRSPRGRRVGERDSPTATSKAVWGFLTALLLLVSWEVVPVICASAQTSNQIPSVVTITARMAQAQTTNEAHFRPYNVTRDYTMFRQDKNDAMSQVTANITFIPPELKTYAIQRSPGNGLEETIVRRMLEGELAISKDASASEMSRDNYDFLFVREEDVDGQHCYVLELIPRRKDKNLLRGNVWVDAQTYLLHRAEGSLAKNPSWWVRDVHIVLLFGDAGGMWLVTGSEATANVRIIGPSTMISRDVKYDISEVVAAGPVAPMDSPAGH